MSRGYSPYDPDPTPQRWKLSGSMAGLADRGPKAPAKHCFDERFMTSGQIKKHRRNLMIALAKANGMSERWIAAAVGLPHSVVHAILAKYRDAWTPSS